MFSIVIKEKKTVCKWLGKRDLKKKKKLKQKKYFRVMERRERIYSFTVSICCIALCKDESLAYAVWILHQ